MANEMDPKTSSSEQSNNDGSAVETSAKSNTSNTSRWFILLGSIVLLAALGTFVRGNLSGKAMGGPSMGCGGGAPDVQTQASDNSTPKVSTSKKSLTSCSRWVDLKAHDSKSSGSSGQNICVYQLEQDTYGRYIYKGCASLQKDQTTRFCLDFTNKRAYPTNYVADGYYVYNTANNKVKITAVNKSGSSTTFQYFRGATEIAGSDKCGTDTAFEIPSGRSVYLSNWESNYNGCGISVIKINISEDPMRRYESIPSPSTDFQGNPGDKVIAVNTSMTYQEAHKHCRTQYGTSLVSTTSFAALQELYHYGKQQGLSGNMWIGLNVLSGGDTYSENIAVWTDFNDRSYTHYWGFSASVHKPCVLAQWHSSAGEAYMYSGVCTDKRSFFCWKPTAKAQTYFLYLEKIEFPSSGVLLNKIPNCPTLSTANKSLAEAKTWCDTNSTCAGFHGPVSIFRTLGRGDVTFLQKHNDCSQTRTLPAGNHAAFPKDSPYW